MPRLALDYVFSKFAALTFILLCCSAMMATGIWLVDRGYLLWELPSKPSLPTTLLNPPCCSAMMATGIWLIVATYWELPVSTTHSIGAQNALVHPALHCRCCSAVLLASTAGMPHPRPASCGRTLGGELAITGWAGSQPCLPSPRCHWLAAPCSGCYHWVYHGVCGPQRCGVDRPQGRVSLPGRGGLPLRLLVRGEPRVLSV